MVLSFHTLTRARGLGGSERRVRLELRRVPPMVSTPEWKPAVRKFWSPMSPWPAGLTCAYHLAGMGHQVIIYERLGEPVPLNLGFFDGAG